MTTARSQIVDTDLTRYYHCISRCVRGAFLCGEGYEHRKDWIEQRIELLAANFALSVAGFSVMDNHILCFCDWIRTMFRFGAIRKCSGDGLGFIPRQTWTSTILMSCKCGWITMSKIRNGSKNFVSD